MLFYDVEALPYYWCIVVVDDETDERHVFEDVPSLRAFYKNHYKTHTWVGYNSRQYDQCMIRFIMLGLDPYECSQALIELGKKWFEFPFQVTEAYKRLPLRNYDCVLLNKGLKKLEGFRGSSIIECEIDWNYDKPLTRAQKDKVVFYCTHDVVECRKVFYDNYEDYEAHEGLIEQFDIDPIHFSKSKAQLSALILGAKKQSWFDEWNFEIVDTLSLDKYKFVEDWYRDNENHNYKKSLETEIAGVPHTFAWGGIHGARVNYAGEGRYINMDVGSYYPALMIEYNFLSRNVLSPEKFREIRDYRLVLKANKDPRQLPYKIVINSTFGAMKDKYNNLYDPKNANNVCVNGQLLLLDLIEKVEDHCVLIQSNTDGILVKVETDAQAEAVRTAADAWSQRTRMELEFENVVKIFQKDVNNYLLVTDEGKIKSKGAFAKDWMKEIKVSGVKTKVNDLCDYDLVILREALHNFLAKGIPVRQTIMDCTDLRKFQKIVMVSRKYKHALHGTPLKVKYKDEMNKGKEKLMPTEQMKQLRERHLRVFASTFAGDGAIYKVHAVKGNLNKVGDTPDKAFIVNEDITGKTTNDFLELDKEWYIKLAEKRIKGYMPKLPDVV